MFWDGGRYVLQPVDRDRTGAHSTATIMELTQKLKEIHGQHLSAIAYSLTMWANSIHAAPSHKQESMVNEMPPPHLIHLFRSIPLCETDNVKTLCEEFQKIKETMLRVFDLYEVRLKATVRRICWLRTTNWLPLWEIFCMWK